MRKYCLIGIVILILLAAPTVFAGGALHFAEAGISMEAPDGFTVHTRADGAFTERAEAFGLGSVVLAVRSLPLYNFPAAEDYIMTDANGEYLAYAVVYRGEHAQDIWSLSDVDKATVTQTLDGLQTDDADAALHTGDYLFIRVVEDGSIDGYRVASYAGIENGYNIVIYVSSPHGDSTVIGDTIAASVAVTPRVNGRLVAGWAVAIAVSALLATLFFRQRARPAELTRTEFERLQGYGWVVILVIVALFINIVTLLAALFADYSGLAPATAAAAMAVNIASLALRILLLAAIFRKSKYFAPLYIITMILVLCGNAAFQAYESMAFSVVDVAVCIYLLYSKRIAAVFRFRKLEIIENRRPFTLQEEEK